MAPTKNVPTLRVYIQIGKHIHLIGKVPKRQALYMCASFKPLLDRGGCPQMKDAEAVIFNAPFVDIDSVRAMIDFIKPYNTFGDFEKQAPTTKHVGVSDLTSQLQFYSTIAQFGLKRSMRGDSLREEILQQVFEARVTLKQLKLIHGFAFYDNGVFHATLRNLAYFKVTSAPSAEIAEIEAYLHDNRLDRKFAAMVRDAYAETTKPYLESTKAEQMPAANQFSQPAPKTTWASKVKAGISGA